MLDIKSHFQFRNQNNFNKSRSLNEEINFWSRNKKKNVETLVEPKNIIFFICFFFLGFHKTFNEVSSFIRPISDEAILSYSPESCIFNPKSFRRQLQNVSRLVSYLALRSHKLN